LVSKPSYEEYVDKDGTVRMVSTGMSMQLGEISVGSSYGGLITFENGDMKDLGDYATKEGFLAAAKAFCDEQVKIGNMTRQEADRILSQYE
jgi:hypothetical protein